MNALFLESGSFWFTPPGTEFAEEVHFLFHFITWVSAFFFFGIVIAGTWFVIKYRRRDGVDAQPSSSHNTTLEIVWSVFPTILLVAMFYLGFETYMDMRTPPPGTYDIQVTGQKWSWTFQYPDGTITNELHAPKGRDVRLVMQSTDVIHSFFIPDFAVKQDVVPGRYTYLWFNSTAVGEHIVFCAEYCGTAHSTMRSICVIDEQADFDAWLEEAANFVDRMDPVEAGRRVYEIYGCAQCHTVDGTPATAPSFKGSWTWGSERPIESGTVVVDENYVRESILDPKAKVARGFEPVMPTFQGQVNDKKIGAFIAYLKSLNEGGE